MRVAGRALAPVGLGHSEAFQHGLRAQEPGRDGHGRDAVRPELSRLGDGEADNRGLRQVVEESAPIPVRVAVGDLHDEAALTGDHEGERVPAGDDVGLHRLPQEPQSGLQVLFPHGVFPVGQRVATPYGVDQDVEPTVLFGGDPVDEDPDLLGAAVVGADGDAVAARGGDQFRGFLDGFRAVHVGTPGLAAAAGDVHRRTCGAEFDGDASSASPCAAGDQGHLSGQRTCVGLHDSSWEWPRSGGRCGDRTALSSCLSRCSRLPSRSSAHVRPAPALIA